MFCSAFPTITQFFNRSNFHSVIHPEKKFKEKTETWRATLSQKDSLVLNKKIADATPFQLGELIAEDIQWSTDACRLCDWVSEELLDSCSLKWKQFFWSLLWKDTVYSEYLEKFFPTLLNCLNFVCVSWWKLAPQWKTKKVTFLCSPLRYTVLSEEAVFFKITSHLDLKLKSGQKIEKFVSFPGSQADF